jgi:predicted transcriptional regulator
MEFKEYENVEYLIKEIVYSIINRNPNIKKTFREELNLIDIDMFSKKIYDILSNENLNNKIEKNKIEKGDKAPNNIEIILRTLSREELEKRVENCLMLEILSKILYNIPEKQKKLFFDIIDNEK